MSDYNPDDLEKLKSDLHNNIQILKENVESEEDLENLNKFIDYLSDMDAQSDDDEKKAEGISLINKGLVVFQDLVDGIQRDVNIDPGRLAGLTDGVFSIVMTLLVFGIAAPNIEMNSYSHFISFITALIPTIATTIVSFVILSSFWIYHHEFLKIKNFNLLYIWLNIIFLICVSFVPFTTSLIGKYSHFFLSEVLFGINILLNIVSFLLLYLYAYKKDFLENKPSKKEKRHVLNTFLIIMALTIIVNLLDFNVSGNFIFLFLLIPVISTLSDIVFKWKS
ncbi:TMEM175 family protein [Methanobrevibacter sp. YE315]|uniref:TMEM175 family protein n=1 Tax=Methanobrevibacter sp. YE315 TaxID=1609968 RepID=UPI0008365BB6|nr:TMEM175 family protein [Methanobrevibacter sp. YE315]